MSPANTADDRVIVKLYRRLQTGIHPEIEIGRFLTDVARYANAPRLLGSLERVGSDGSLTAVAVVHEFVRNQGDGWAMTLDHLGRMLDEFDLWLSSEEETFDAAAIHMAYWLRAETLARRIGELHRALALDVTDPAFAPEAVSADDLAAWTGLLSELAAKARDSLGRAVASDRLSEEAMGLAKRLMNDWGTIEKMCVVPAAAHAGTLKTRIHGDLHLGQVVVTGADFYVLDFEGEPLHAIERRRAKYSPLRDVAGMIRSFDYAGNAVLQRRRPGAQTGDGSAAYRAVIEDWRRETTERFLAAYRDSVAGCPAVPQQHQPFAAALHVYVLEKALYEVCYEAANRPDWLAIPLAGVGRLLDRAPPPD
jgi:maltose alpha-D-glucosyltransferase/alpha-amylase